MGLDAFEHSIAVLSARSQIIRMPCPCGIHFGDARGKAVRDYLILLWAGAGGKPGLAGQVTPKPVPFWLQPSRLGYRWLPRPAIIIRISRLQRLVFPDVSEHFTDGHRESPDLGRLCLPAY